MEGRVKVIMIDFLINTSCIVGPDGENLVKFPSSANVEKEGPTLLSHQSATVTGVEYSRLRNTEVRKNPYLADRKPDLYWSCPLITA